MGRNQGPALLCMSDKIVVISARQNNRRDISVIDCPTVFMREAISVYRRPFA